MARRVAIVATVAAALLLPAKALAVADLSVSVTDSPDPVSAGGALTYKLSVINNGPDAALSVALSNPIPSGTTFASLSGAPWTLTTPPMGGTGTVTATTSSMGQFTGAFFTLVVNTTTAGPFTETATVGSASPDPNPANNSATILTNEPVAAPVSPAAVAPAPTPTAKKRKCKKRKHTAAAAKKKRCKKRR